MNNNSKKYLSIIVILFLVILIYGISSNINTQKSTKNNVEKVVVNDKMNEESVTEKIISNDSPDTGSTVEEIAVNNDIDTKNAVEEFAINNAVNSILSETHKVNKKIIRHDIAWVGIDVKQNNSTDMWRLDNPDYYELWRTDKDGNTLLVENFPMTIFNKVNWKANRKRGIDVQFYSGGPEGGVTTDIVYDHQGVEQLSIERETLKDFTFTFRKKVNIPYEVSPLIEGSCYGEWSKDRDRTIPEVTLKGVKLTKHYREKEFILNKSEKVECEVHPHGHLIDPGIEILQFDDESIEFTLTNNQKGIIYLKSTDHPDSPEFSEVEFE